MAFQQDQEQDQQQQQQHPQESDLEILQDLDFGHLLESWNLNADRSRFGKTGTENDGFYNGTPDSVEGYLPLDYSTHVPVSPGETSGAIPQEHYDIDLSQSSAHDTSSSSTSQSHPSHILIPRNMTPGIDEASSSDAAVLTDTTFGSQSTSSGQRLSLIYTPTQSQSSASLPRCLTPGGSSPSHPNSTPTVDPFLDLFFEQTRDSGQPVDDFNQVAEVAVPNVPSSDRNAKNAEAPYDPGPQRQSANEILLDLPVFPPVELSLADKPHLSEQHHKRLRTNKEPELPGTSKSLRHKRRQLDKNKLEKVNLTRAAKACIRCQMLHEEVQSHSVIPLTSKLTETVWDWGNLSTLSRHRSYRNDMDDALRSSSPC